LLRYSARRNSKAADINCPGAETNRVGGREVRRDGNGLRETQTKALLVSTFA
jgi:hypothetical protein